MAKTIRFTLPAVCMSVWLAGGPAQAQDNADAPLQDPALQALEQQLPPDKLKQFYRDLDNDGISDILDECPNTPPGVKVDIIGCEVDQDGDGVGDSRDQCPDTPRNTRVNLLGCPFDATADADEDGVLDTQDKCPNTPAGTPVDNDGCPLKKAAAPDAGTTSPAVPASEPPMAETIPVPESPAQSTPAPMPVQQAQPVETGATHAVVRLTFDTGEFTIRPDQRARLDRAIRQLKTLQPGQVVLVEGHTDAIGCQDDNLKLSWNRAWAVKQYLVQHHGYDAERIFIVGYGENRPVADNWTAEGRRQNRRIELHITQTVPEAAEATLPEAMKGYVRRPGRCPLPDDK